MTKMANLIRVFIVGLPRTGTTFVRSVLTHHRDIRCVQSETNLFLFPKIRALLKGETDAVQDFISYFWGHVYRRTYPWGWDTGLFNQLSREQAEKYINRYVTNVFNELDPVECFAELIDNLFANGHEVKGWLEKTPNQSQVIDLIKKVFPDSIVICTERDRKLIEASLPEQNWYDKQRDPKDTVDQLLTVIEQHLEKFPDIIRVNHLEFTRDPEPLFEELSKRGLAADGFDECREWHAAKADEGIATRTKDDKSKRIN